MIANKESGDSLFQEYYIKMMITVEGDNFESEKKYLNTILVKDLKMRLELMTGIRSDSMSIELYVNNEKTQLLDNDNLSLSQVMPGDGSINQLRLHILENREKIKFDEEIEKFNLSDENYANRNDSVRKYLMDNKLGPYSKKKDVSKYFEEWTGLMNEMNVGDKCLVKLIEEPMREATIKFKGTTQFETGPWVGVEFYEPVGRNDGSVRGIRYFECNSNFGAFVRPNKIKLIDC